MLDLLLSPLQFRFFVIALIAGAFIALAASLLGTHLTLKGFSMIGDGLSHVGFGAIAVASAASLFPLAVALPVVVLAAFLLLRLQKQKGKSAEAAIAMLSSVSLAVGVIAVALSGTNFDLNSYLFGSILAVSESDLWWIVPLCSAVIVLYVLFYPRFFTLTHDEEFLRAVGEKSEPIRTLLAALSAVVVVLGMQTAGALLIGALLIFPPESAMCLARSFRSTVILSAVLSVSALVLGLFFSFFFSLPAGAAIVVTNGLCYLVCRAVGALRRRK